MKNTSKSDFKYLILNFFSISFHLNLLTYEEMNFYNFPIAQNSFFRIRILKGKDGVEQQKYFLKILELLAVCNEVRKLLISNKFLSWHRA